MIKNVEEADPEGAENVDAGADDCNHKEEEAAVEGGGDGFYFAG